MRPARLPAGHQPAPPPPRAFPNLLPSRWVSQGLYSGAGGKTSGPPYPPETFGAKCLLRFKDQLRSCVVLGKSFNLSALPVCKMGCPKELVSDSIAYIRQGTL